FLRRQGINGVVQPAMPGLRHDRSLRGAAINHPASLESEPRIDLAAPRAVIAIADLVLAPVPAVERGPQPRAGGRPAPPRQAAPQARRDCRWQESEPIPCPSSSSLGDSHALIISRLTRIP